MSENKANGYESKKGVIQRRVPTAMIIFIIIATFFGGCRTLIESWKEEALIPVNQDWKWVMVSPKGNVIDRGEVNMIHRGIDLVFEASYRNDANEKKWAKCVVNITTNRTGTWIQNDPLPNGKYTAVLSGWKQTQSRDRFTSQAFGYRDGNLIYIERTD